MTVGVVSRAERVGSAWQRAAAMRIEEDRWEDTTTGKLTIQLL